METLSREFRVSCPRELLYADDLPILSDSFVDLKNRLAAWNTSLEFSWVFLYSRQSWFTDWKNLTILVYDKTKILISRAEHNKFQQVIQSTLVVYVTLVLVLTPCHALHVICRFKISIHAKLIALLTTNLRNVSVKSYLLLLHPLTSGMTNLMSNPPSIILAIQLTNVVVVLTQFLQILFHHGKHSENCYLSSPTVQSKQSFHGMSTAYV